MLEPKNDSTNICCSALQSFFVVAYVVLGQAGTLYLSALLVPNSLLPQLKSLKFSPRTRTCEVEIFLVGMRNLKPKGRVRPLNKPWLEVDVGDKSDKAKVFKTKSSDNPSKFNPNFFESIKLRVDIPEELCLVPKLSFTAIDSMMLREYNIGAASVSLLEYLPWLTSHERDQARAGIVDPVAQSTSLLTLQPKVAEHRAPHVSVNIEQEEDAASEETKPLLSGHFCLFMCEHRRIYMYTCICVYICVYFIVLLV